VAHPTSANCSSNSSIKTATANSATTNAPVANRFRIFSVNNKATKPHPADPEPVDPVRVVPAVPAKAAGADVPATRGKAADPDLAVPVRADSPEAPADNPCIALWPWHWTPIAMESSPPVN